MQDLSSRSSEEQPVLLTIALAHKMVFKESSDLAMMKMQIKITLKFHLILIRMAVIMKTDNRAREMDQVVKGMHVPTLILTQ